MTDKLVSRLLTGGALALFVANVYLRWREARAPKPDYLSAEALEHALRVASSQGGCYAGE